MNLSELRILFNDLPDDPLKMPPPFWQSNGAYLHIIDSLDQIVQLLPKLIPHHEKTKQRLRILLDKYPDNSELDGQYFEEYDKITDDLIRYVHKINLRVQNACLMSAIQTEDEIHRFCVFNLRKDVAELLERRPLKVKFSESVNYVSGQSPKGTPVFESLMKLSEWRNAFAHGHCTNRPVGNLRDNHLNPGEPPNMLNVIAELQKYVGAYLHVSEYLCEKSVNEYTKKRPESSDQIRELLREISKYRFEGDIWLFDVMLSDEEQVRLESQLRKLLSSNNAAVRSQVESVLDTLDPFPRYIVALELGLAAEGESRGDFMKVFEMDEDEYAYQKGLAITRIAHIKYLDVEKPPTFE